MKIGFIVPIKNSLNTKETGVWGDEIVSNAYSRSINNVTGKSCGVYTLRECPHLDVAIHTNHMVHPSMFSALADKHVLWIQGVTYDTQNGGIIPLTKIYDDFSGKFNSVITLSRKLATDKNIPFIPPCVDMHFFHDIQEDGYLYDISFIGNLIKSHEITERYLSPMGKFNYGLFGGELGKVSHERSLEIMCQSKMNLHFGFEQNIEWDMVMGRPLHISACRGFTLSDKVPYLMEIYKDAFGFTDGGDDEIEKIKYFIENDNIRNKMRQVAYEITANNFSSDILSKKLLEVL